MSFLIREPEIPVLTPFISSNVEENSASTFELILLYVKVLSEGFETGPMCVKLLGFEVLEKAVFGDR